MTAQSRIRVAAALGALLAPLAFVAATQSAAEASSARPHDLRMYKVEKYVAVDGEYPDQSADVTLKCNTGDYAVDGMWKIDHVDDDYDDWGDRVAGDPKKVFFYASYSEANKSDWHFKFFNDNPGRAQVKLWVTCLGGKTDKAFNHTHPILLDRYTAAQALTTATHNYSWSGSCAPDAVEVAPGFDFGAPVATLWGSWPEQAAGHAWQWWFDLSADAPSAQFYVSCLNVKTGPASSGPAHRHNVLYRWTNDKLTPSAEHVSVAAQTEEQVSCDDRSKALVGAFYIQQPSHVWYLGMEPRIKTRVFWFGNDGGGDDTVYLNVLCVNDRSSRQKA